MTYIYDEQVLASVYCIKGWKKYTRSFLESAYYYQAEQLSVSGIMWIRPKEKETALDELAKKYKSIFKRKEKHIEITLDQNSMYQMFLGGYPKEDQEVLAAFVKMIAG